MASIRSFSLACLVLTSSISGAFVHMFEAIAAEVHERRLNEPDLWSIGSIVAWVLRTASFVWKPDAHASLALDRLTHGTITAHDLTVAQRFKAFIERARLALRFDGDGFMHGRPNHLMC